MALARNHRAMPRAGFPANEGSAARKAAFRIEPRAPASPAQRRVGVRAERAVGAGRARPDCGLPGTEHLPSLLCAAVEAVTAGAAEDQRRSRRRHAEPETVPALFGKRQVFEQSVFKKLEFSNTSATRSRSHAASKGARCAVSFLPGSPAARLRSEHASRPGGHAASTRLPRTGLRRRPRPGSRRPGARAVAARADAASNMALARNHRAMPRAGFAANEASAAREAAFRIESSPAAPPSHDRRLAPRGRTLRSRSRGHARERLSGHGAPARLPRTSKAAWARCSCSSPPVRLVGPARACGDVPIT
jgi:hypothetical protein